MMHSKNPPYLLVLPIMLLSSAWAQGAPLELKEEKPLEKLGSTTVITVDEAFTTKHENDPPSVPFRVSVPKGKDLRFLPGGKKTGAPELVRLTLPNAAGDQAAEILRFGKLELKQGPVEERVAAAAAMLEREAFPMFTNGFEDPKQLEIYQTKVGAYDAVCLHIQMSQPGGGPVYLVKAMAILHPTEAGGVVAFLMADDKESAVKTVADLGQQGIGLAIIHSIDFLTTPATP